MAFYEGFNKKYAFLSRHAPSLSPGMSCRASYSTSGGGGHGDWDINDSAVPRIHDFDQFSEWADGHCRLVYR